MSKRKRIVGTTPEAVEATEKALGRRLPPSFREWILAHNGTGGIEDVEIYPVPDSRAPRTLQDNILHHDEAWREGADLEPLESRLRHMLPFGGSVNDETRIFCFDYGTTDPMSPMERPVVCLWTDSEEMEPYGESFAEFCRRYEQECADLENHEP
jgi:hypothetical protein